MPLVVQLRVRTGGVTLYHLELDYHQLWAVCVCVYVFMYLESFLPFTSRNERSLNGSITITNTHMHKLTSTYTKRLGSRVCIIIIQIIKGDQ